MNIIPTFNDYSKSLSRRSDSESGEIPDKNSLEQRWKRHHRELRSEDVKRHLSSSYSSKEKYDSCSKAESVDEEQSTNMQHLQYHRAQTSGTENDLAIDIHK